MCAVERGCIFREPCPEHREALTAADRVYRALAERIKADLPDVAEPGVSARRWFGGPRRLVHLIAVRAIDKPPTNNGNGHHGGRRYRRKPGEQLCPMDYHGTAPGMIPAPTLEPTCTECMAAAAKYGVAIYREQSAAERHREQNREYMREPNRARRAAERKRAKRAAERQERQPASAPTPEQQRQQWRDYQRRHRLKERGVVASDGERQPGGRAARQAEGW